MTGEIHCHDEEVVVENLDELFTCYKVLRGMARDSRNELSYGRKFVQLNDLIVEMGNDIRDGLMLLNITLFCNIKATYDVASTLLPIEGDDNSTLNFYLGEIKTLIDSYEKHGKDKEDDKK